MPIVVNNLTNVIQLAKVRIEQKEGSIEKEFCATFSEFQYLSPLGSCYLFSKRMAIRIVCR